MRHIDFTVWETVWEQDARWAPGASAAYRDPHVTGAREVTYATRSWDSPGVAVPWGGEDLVASWNARTPATSWLEVLARVSDRADDTVSDRADDTVSDRADDTGDGWSRWFVLGRWAEHDPGYGGGIVRTTVPGQQDERARVGHDTLAAAAGRPFRRWQLRLIAYAPDEAGPWPQVDLVAAVVTAGPAWTGEASVTPLEPGLELPVPPRSQRRHVESVAHWDEGGSTWCSPTSIAMMLEHWQRGPADGELAWLDQDTDPEVVHALWHVFDRGYGGAGNWAFNVAHAATRGLRAYVTRLRDLREVQAFVAAGVPLVLSVAFREDELDGAGYSTDGHLLTVVGFTPTGDVVSNDPNSHEIASNDEVRVVYRREQFERAWLCGSGGIAYVIHPREVPLPAPPAHEPNWA